MTINANSFPLSISPYKSRISGLLFPGLAGDAAKNYPYVAFKPGFPLQASELNEVQEMLMTQTNLNTTFLARFFSQNNQEPTSENSNAAYTLYGNGYLDEAPGFTIEVSGSSITLTIEIGWICVVLDGMRYWIYNEFNREVTLSRSDFASSFVKYLKLNPELLYIPCSSDSSNEGWILNDNSDSTFESGTCGANRIRVRLSDTPITVVNSAQNNCVLKLDSSSNGSSYDIEITDLSVNRILDTTYQI
jgi:hypothetical protein